MTKTLQFSATQHSMMPIASMYDEEENLLFPTLVSDRYESHLVPQNRQNEMHIDVQNNSRATVQPSHDALGRGLDEISGN